MNKSSINLKESIANLKELMTKLKSVKMTDINADIAEKILNLDKAIRELENETRQ